MYPNLDIIPVLFLPSFSTLQNTPGSDFCFLFSLFSSLAAFFNLSHRATEHSVTDYLYHVFVGKI